jgi:hypothetical protein
VGRAGWAGCRGGSLRSRLRDRVRPMRRFTARGHVYGHGLIGLAACPAAAVAAAARAPARSHKLALWASPGPVHVNVHVSGGQSPPARAETAPRPAPCRHDGRSCPFNGPLDPRNCKKKPDPQHGGSGFLITDRAAGKAEAEGLEPPRACARLISNQLPYQLDYASNRKRSRGCAPDGHRASASSRGDRI